MWDEAGWAEAGQVSVTVQSQISSAADDVGANKTAPQRMIWRLVNIHASSTAL
jgi:hypothetical protein